MTHRPTFPALVALAALLGLTGCASGTAAPGSTASTPAAASSGPSSSAPASSGPATPTAQPVAGGGATSFCAAFKELQSVEAATGPATAGIAFRAAATDMRAYAPAEIRSAAGTYADVIDNIGKAAQSGSFDAAGLHKAVAEGMAGKATDIGTVAVWVAKNCKI